MLEMVHPEVYRLGCGGAPAERPVYSLPARFGSGFLPALVAQALAALGRRIEGAMPAGVARRGRRAGGR